MFENSKGIVKVEILISVEIHSDLLIGLSLHKQILTPSEKLRTSYFISLFRLSDDPRVAF